MSQAQRTQLSSVCDRVPHETGYGDFCFSRVLQPDRMKDRDWSYNKATNVLHGTHYESSTQFTPYFRSLDHGMEEWTKDDFMVGSHNVPSPELDGFERQAMTCIFRFAPIN